MPTVVIIHAAEDTLPARALAEKLRQAKLDVVLEKNGDELRSALSSAKVAIGLWSPRSTSQPELADHAVFAKGKTKLIHATMQSAPAPEPFRNENAVNLTGWRGEDDFAAWRDLAKMVTDKAGVAPLPPPVPKPPSGFFQPGVVGDTAQAPPAGQQRQAAPQ
ncbi:MAG: toll/interleukin-1 receptor domain-containing protein, partial [Phycisphaerales bacterium]|nr:toll/interleukin-1 receptor domain-containing protein [Hyphomonadaceae bacterium]